MYVVVTGVTELRPSPVPSRNAARLLSFPSRAHTHHSHEYGSRNGFELTGAANGCSDAPGRV